MTGLHRQATDALLLGLIVGTIMSAAFVALCAAVAALCGVAWLAFQGLSWVLS